MKIAIVGAHEASRENAPYLDDEYEIWGLSNWSKAPWMLRCDAVIEIHKSVLYTQHPIDREYWGWLKETEAKVYIFGYNEEIKNTNCYPLQDIKNDLLGNINLHGREIENFASSADYALALAIQQGYKEIDLYGLEMELEKYEAQRESLAFWVGLATGKGITVNLKCTTAMFNKSLYGRHMVDKDKHIAFINIRSNE